MFSKILIANRGEIAVRIIRACKEMGIATVAVYSEADRDGLHVALADEAVCIGKAETADSYLNEARIISAALATGAKAIHPGYGFLSENAHFAANCRKNALVFIGPTVENMNRLGDKAMIKKLMNEAGLPTIPGTDVLENVDEALEAAERIGYPVMLKARSGGGGRGIRRIDNPEQMKAVYPQAVAESTAAFGDGAVYLEKFVYPARHVEFQVLADEFGNAVCLGERDCSIQRRHQKLIEESPSPAVNPEQRQAVVEKVIKAVKYVGYVGVGTMEFLLDKQGNFWFMEMNVRLQVEHTVTESLTHIDLVKWQIRVAAGIPLNFEQKDISFRGSAMECRINAWMPGKVNMLHVPGGPFVRFDTFLVSGGSVSPHYDSMIGKLIVYAGTREETIRKMRAALCELVIDGIATNLEEQLEITGRPAFVDGSYDLTFMEG